MIYRTTGSWDPKPALGWDEALELGRTRPIVVNKPGHIAAAVADLGGQPLLWLVQGDIGPSYDGDNGALTPWNWAEWNWQTLYPAEALWGGAGRRREDPVRMAELSRRRAAQLKQLAQDLTLQRDGLPGAVAHPSDGIGAAIRASEADSPSPSLRKP
jgi:hypothetical protein